MAGERRGETHGRRSRRGAPGASERPWRSQVDDGFSFVEVVVTIVLVGLVVVPLLAAVRASIRASTVAESAASVETLLVNAVDRVNRADVTDCDYSSEVSAAVETYGWPASAATVVPRYLQDDGSWSDDRGDLDCEDQVRLITITITDPESGLARTLEVVKGDL